MEVRIQARTAAYVVYTVEVITISWTSPRAGVADGGTTTEGGARWSVSSSQSEPSSASSILACLRFFFVLSSVLVAVEADLSWPSAKSEERRSLK